MPVSTRVSAKTPSGCGWEQVDSRAQLSVSRFLPLRSHVRRAVSVCLSLPSITPHRGGNSVGRRGGEAFVPEAGRDAQLPTRQLGQTEVGELAHFAA